MTFKGPFQTKTFYDSNIPCLFLAAWVTLCKADTQPYLVWILLSKGGICFMLSISPLQETAFIQGIFFYMSFCEVVTEKMRLQKLAWNSVWKMMKERENSLCFSTKITGNFSRSVFYLVLSLDRWCWNNSKQTNQKFSHIKEPKCFN